MKSKEQSYPTYTYNKIATDAMVISHMQKIGGVVISIPKQTGFKTKEYNEK